MARKLLLIGLGEVPFADYRQRFNKEGFEVDTALTTAHAQAMIAMKPYDAAVAFADRPERVRNLALALAAESIARPVLIGVTPASVGAELDLLSAGLDGCQPADVSPCELLARLRALLRRASGYPGEHRVGDLGIDPVNRRASRGGVPLPLRPIEFNLLLLLAESDRRPVAAETLIAQLWPAPPDQALQRATARNLLAAHMRNLRLAVDAGQRTRLLHTLRNRGYLLGEPGTVRNWRQRPAQPARAA